MTPLISPALLAAFAPAVGLLLALTCAAFFLRFVWPAIRIGGEFFRAEKNLRALGRKNQAAPDEAFSAAMPSPALKAAWRAYSHSLHREEGAAPRWRSTTLAELFFSQHALIDAPLKTDFYKHLPGILTGIGILGTFAGLILGLSQFAVSSDTSAVRSSLNALIHSVGHAFQVSAAAIGLAMLFTWIEKALIATLIRRLGALTQRIDALFEGASSEEYLARLARNSEAQLRQASEQQQALTAGLRQAFDQIAQRLAEKDAADRQASARAVALAVKEALKEALQESVGAPLAALQASLAATPDPGKLQGELFSRLENSLDRLRQEIERQGSAQGAAQLRQQQEESARSAALLKQIGAEFQTLAAAIERPLGEASATQLAASSDAAGRTLAAGSRQISAACGELANASQRLSGVCSELGATGRSVGELAQSLLAARQREERVLAAQGDLQTKMQASLEALGVTLTAARREASLSGEMISRLEASAAALGRAEQAAADYLGGLNGVLGEAHQAFADNVARTLQSANASFQGELAEAVAHLQRSIDELGDALAGAGR